MRIVIELADEAVPPDVMIRYLINMQAESDEIGAEYPADYPEGFGSLALETRHMSVGAKIVGIFRKADLPSPAEIGVIEPIK